MAQVAPAPGEDTSPALALVNTRLVGRDGGDLDLIATPTEAARWLTDRSLGEASIGETDVARLAELRSAVHDLFTAHTDVREPDRQSVDMVNTASRAVARAPLVVWSPDGPLREWVSSKANSVDDAVARIAADAIDVLCGDRGATLRRCEAHGCVRLFLREHARRRWCSTTCGDRVRAARHYRLQQTQRRT